MPGAIATPERWVIFQSLIPLAAATAEGGVDPAVDTPTVTALVREVPGGWAVSRVTRAVLLPLAQTEESPGSQTLWYWSASAGQNTHLQARQTVLLLLSGWKTTSVTLSSRHQLRPPQLPQRPSLLCCRGVPLAPQCCAPQWKLRQLYVHIRTDGVKRYRGGREIHRGRCRAKHWCSEMMRMTEMTPPSLFR
jgi:hypothetical protein